MIKDLIEVARGRKKANLLLKNARVVDVFNCTIEEMNIAISSGIFVGPGEYEAEEVLDLNGKIVAPGFIDGHVHIESSMLSPFEFGRAVVKNGTTAVVADPHEIVNVAGEAGLEYMIRASDFDFVDIFFMLPSCVPATHLETNGGEFGPKEIKKWLTNERVLGLAEMMNFPGVIHGDDEVLRKIEYSRGRIIDGHAPLLSGEKLNAYILAGISSDHECTNFEEAKEKLSKGMFIMIREGSAARNLDELIKLVNEKNHERFGFVTDDRHPDFLMDYGHINSMVKRAIKKGIDPVVAFKLASFNTARYFNLRYRGAIAPGYLADFVIIDDLENFNILGVYKSGRPVVVEGEVCADLKRPDTSFPDNSINTGKLDGSRLRIEAKTNRINVIEIIPGQILTKKVVIDARIDNGEVVPDVEKDILKLVVVERHRATGNIEIGFVRGIGIKAGAIASTVAHDSHNIIVVGTNDHDILFAVERIKELGGGQVVVEDGRVLEELSLPIAGLMSDEPLELLRKKCDRLNNAARTIGCRLENPFMVLSFLALPVIPELRLTDKGLVDVNKFDFVSIYAD